MKYKKMIISLLIITLLVSGPIIFTNIVSVIGGHAADGAGGNMPSNRPILKVSLTSKLTYIDGEPVDTWLYVTNPSRSMDRLGLLPDPPYTEILHTITINYLQINFIDSDGTEYINTYYPPEGEPQDWDDYRWDAVVNPRETSLVFYIGWRWISELGSVPGVVRFMYLLNCEYEGLEYNLVYKFAIVVRP